MAGRRVYGGSDMAVFLQNERMSANNTSESFLSPITSHSFFNGSRTMLNFEEVCRSTMNPAFYRPRDIFEEICDDDFDDCLHQPEKKRRLTSDQVQFLERSFEVENKLEPERKVQLAKDLGLQPRQVAIWFQNRRARWKNKQLEKDYDDLKSTYNALKSEFEELLKEKEKLKAEVLHLKLHLGEEQNENLEEFETKQQDYGSPVEMKLSDSQGLDGKQEDGSSSNSNIFESESPRYTDGGLTDSSILFERDHSDVNQEDEEVRGYHEFFKLDQDDSAGFDFAVEDHTFWFWA